MVFDLEQYMNRLCVCGLPRKDHAHAHVDNVLCVIVPHEPSRCHGFLDEIENRLGGNPWHNPLLRPLIEKEAGRASDAVQN